MREKLNLNRKSLSLVCLALGMCLGLVSGIVLEERLHNSQTRPDTLKTKFFAKKLSPTIEDMKSFKLGAWDEKQKWFKTEKEIIQWAKRKSLYPVQTYRYQRRNKKIVAVMVNELGSYPNIYLFAHLTYPERPDVGDTGWSLMFYRDTRSSEVSLWVGQNPDELYFRSKSGHVLLSVDMNNLDYDH